MSTPLEDLDARAQALMDDYRALIEVSVDQSNLPSWFATWSQLKMRVQTLWIEQIVGQYQRPGDEATDALHKRYTQHWLPELEKLDGVLNELANQIGLESVNPAVSALIASGPAPSPRMAELEQEFRRLTKQYQDVVSQHHVMFAGKMLTMADAEHILRESQDRNEREAVWNAVKAVEMASASGLDDLFAKILSVRRAMAAEAGQANYASYSWLDRNDTIAGTEELLRTISEVFHPVDGSLHTHRAKALGVPTLRPWDLQVALVEPKSFDLPLDQYVPTAIQVLNSLDTRFGEVVHQIQQYEGFDLAPRPGKPNGNICAHFMATGRSVLVCNFTGGVNLFRGFLHELGHAIHNHTISSNPDHVFWDFINFWEVQEFYAFVFTYIGLLEFFELHNIAEDERTWYLRSTAERIMERFRDVEERTRLELWIYQQEQQPTAEEIDAEFLRLVQTSGVDWSGFEDILKKGWQKPHTFRFAFYNVDFAIAMIAALQFVHAFNQDRNAALERLKSSMLLGATTGSKRIFAEAGIAYPFQKEQLALARTVLAEWLT
ncbi:hypothetical protein DEIGR_310059 [Deinococcus grandis]|uniref:Peptidase M3A/M3B catalytic domain-containing protein n=1 Tax=Deinococcus grandis TaxID=57498 RepID=A0A100HPV5_9DEIO|nr:M3 family metallopeptidase [Deinococcus grandis]BBN97200.1 oligoendopeptidase F [Deinococcus grandis]GAQ23540.1 hypothetical protein DEIGR_310059 [Deinococcus grandis]